MWKKLGTSTGVAESGTEEEFDYALDLYNKGKVGKLFSEEEDVCGIT